MSRKHKANLQPPSEAHRSFWTRHYQGRNDRAQLLLSSPHIAWHWYSKHKMLCWSRISLKLPGNKASMRKPEQRYVFSAWQDKLTSVMFEMYISMMSLYTSDSGTRDWILAGPGLGYISLQDQELLLSCIRCCNILHHLTSLVHGLQASLPPSPNYLNKQPGHIYDSLKIMMTWPKSFYSDILAVYWA